MPEIKTCGKCAEIGEDVEVVCAAGRVRGCRVTTCYGPQFIRFAGLPYAKPPIGPLRFLPPVPAEKWENTLDATYLKTQAWSIDRRTQEVTGSEDCLYTTVYTPDVQPAAPMPVMVWIGGFYFDYDNHHVLGPGWFTEQRTVVIKLSYRIGPFGFLSIQEATAPGNCGLKDVVEALRWIQRNISAFGGDPNNVTLFGCSSGASMVHYMMLSPMANGLFHKVILQSGSAIHHWAFEYHPIKAAKVLAEELGVNTKDMVEAVEEMRRIPAKELMEVFANVLDRIDKKRAFYSLFKPCVEVEFEGQPAFLTQYPYYLLKFGKFKKVPMIIGNNKHEAKSLTYGKKLLLTGMFKKLNKDQTFFVPLELALQDSSRNCKNLGRRLLQFYTQGDTINEENTEDFFNYLTDYYFTYHVYKCLKTHATHSHSSVFYYITEATIEWNGPSEFNVMKESASHGIDLVFLFQMFNCVYYSGTENSKKITEKMHKLWTNFARYGNPTPEEHDELLQVRWDAVTDPKQLKYLRIASDLTKGCNPFYERMQFWDAVLNETGPNRIFAFFESMEETTTNWIDKKEEV